MMLRTMQTTATLHKPKMLVFLPLTNGSHPICPFLNPLSDSVDFRILNSSDDFYELPFLAHTVDCLAVMGLSAQQLDRLIEKLPNLKWVHSFFAGVDAILGPGLASRRDLPLTNAKGAFSQSLAEFAIFGFMYFTKCLPRAISLYRGREYTKFMPSMLKDKTVGIIGYGDIGMHIARLAKAFGMRVVAIKRDTLSVPEQARQWCDELHPTSSLQQVLSQSDYVVTLLPGTPSTKHFFNKDTFDMMKKSAVFMNLGRGITTSSFDLVQALKAETIAGAVLDVQEQEPTPYDSPLYDIGEDKLLLFPHCADYVKEYWPDCASCLLRNSALFVAGEPFPYFVNKQAGY